MITHKRKIVVFSMILLSTMLACSVFSRGASDSSSKVPSNLSTSPSKVESPSETPDNLVTPIPEMEPTLENDVRSNGPIEIGMGDLTIIGDAQILVARWFIDECDNHDAAFFEIISKNFVPSDWYLTDWKGNLFDEKLMDCTKYVFPEYTGTWSASNPSRNNMRRENLVLAVDDLSVYLDMTLHLTGSKREELTVSINYAKDLYSDIPPEWEFKPEARSFLLDSKIIPDIDPVAFQKASGSNLILSFSDITTSFEGKKPEVVTNMTLSNVGDKTLQIDEEDFYIINDAGFIWDLYLPPEFLEPIAPGTTVNGQINILLQTRLSHDYSAANNYVYITGVLEDELGTTLVFESQKYGSETQTYFNLTSYEWEYDRYLSGNN